MVVPPVVPPAEMNAAPTRGARAARNKKAPPPAASRARPGVRSLDAKWCGQEVSALTREGGRDERSPDGARRHGVDADTLLEHLRTQEDEVGGDGWRDADPVSSLTTTGGEGERRRALRKGSRSSSASCSNDDAWGGRRLRVLSQGVCECGDGSLGGGVGEEARVPLVCAQRAIRREGYCARGAGEKSALARSTMAGRYSEEERRSGRIRTIFFITTSCSPRNPPLRRHTTAATGGGTPRPSLCAALKVRTEKQAVPCCRLRKQKASRAAAAAGAGCCGVHAVTDVLLMMAPPWFIFGRAALVRKNMEKMFVLKVR